MSVSRRQVLKFAAATPGLVDLGAAAASLRAAPVSAASLGTLLDYAAGVIPASQIRAAGAVGSIRYVSDRRPGGAWMLGKPIQIGEARDLVGNGLKVVSCYQYGKGAPRTGWVVLPRAYSTPGAAWSCTRRPAARQVPPSMPQSTTTRLTSSTRTR
ncbi:hypothetical protein MSHO_00050 [Mycobacterium shottsii]|uniref:Rv2525c-like glycoside hydrolase-like domain-containing protein n=1 Tax=Mycobacterium shottsii TaxID=133549 RepID=A0A7I7L4R5_9MYCO|nr:hypothetical protein MSHO_00050 [Mycobacterium shottsii]